MGALSLDVDDIEQLLTDSERRVTSHSSGWSAAIYNFRCCCISEIWLNSPQLLVKARTPDVALS